MLATLATTSTTRFASTVRAKLTANKIAGRKPDSIRSLARMMANDDAGLAETHKRSLFKWMSPHGPQASAGSRALVAHALGDCDPEELAEDDEEADPVAAFHHALLALVRDAIQKSNEPSVSLAGTPLGSQPHGG